MSPIKLACLAGHFFQTRWLLNFNDRAELEAWQARRIRRFLNKQLIRTPFYRRYADRALEQLPIVDKDVMLRHFGQMNAAGITLEEATAVALASEASRDFAPCLRGITVGLSSGTSGSRGIFLTTAQESAKWAGIMMARTLPADMMRALLSGSAPVKIAFFLRANSNLYTTLGSKRIHFHFYDLFDGLDIHLPQLERQAPDILVAPAHVLGRLAELVLNGSLRVKPRRVISVAEVLEPDDKSRIELAFGGMAHQLYQCTEGFLGFTCEHGVMHLNEEFIHIEPEWLDTERTRFVPIITDFSRTTQLIIRYRLNDVLRVRDRPCGCGRVSLALAAVEGRCDEILWLSNPDSEEMAPIYPDMLRHAITSAAGTLPDYRIEQHGFELRIGVADNDERSSLAIAEAIRRLVRRHRLREPYFTTVPFIGTEAHAKRRRIICARRPVENSIAHTAGLPDSRASHA
jgi:putative adenylate-forming enzyme